MECRSCDRRAAVHCRNGQCGACCSGDGCRRHQGIAAQQRIDQVQDERDFAVNLNRIVCFQMVDEWRAEEARHERSLARRIGRLFGR